MRASLQSEKDRRNIDIYRGFIEKFSLFWDRREAKYHISDIKIILNALLSVKRECWHFSLGLGTMTTSKSSKALGQQQPQTIQQSWGEGLRFSHSIFASWSRIEVLFINYDISPLTPINRYVTQSNGLPPPIAPAPQTAYTSQVEGWMLISEFFLGGWVFTSVRKIPVKYL